MACVGVIIYTNAIHMHVCLDLMKHIFIWISLERQMGNFIFLFYFANEKF